LEAYGENKCKGRQATGGRRQANLSALFSSSFTLYALRHSRQPKELRIVKPWENPAQNRV